MKFVVKILEPIHALDWIKLRFEGARDFPLGFLINEEEASKITEDRAMEIMNFGSIHGVFHQDKLVGFCGYRREHFERTRHRAEVGPFFITADYQGSGAAKNLMASVIDEASQGGVEQLELFVDTENFRAIRFYEIFGFERIATHPDGVRIDGVSRDDHFYCLRITR